MEWNRTLGRALVLSTLALGCTSAREDSGAASREDVRQPAAGGVDAATVLATIEAAGPDSVVRWILGDARFGNCGATLGDSIATGDSLWLLVAQRIETHTDACLGEELSYALPLALATAPARVLRAFPNRQLCHAPAYEEQPESLTVQFVARARLALTAILAGPDSARASTCLRKLEASAESVRPSAG